MGPTTLTDLPPELLDHITTYLPTAQSLTHFAATSKRLSAFVEKDAWQTFGRARFPSVYPTSPPSHKEAVRSLATLSKAWDRRAFVSRYIEPHGDIHSYPGDKKVDRWKRPRGQTIGFTPHLDVYEQIGTRWQDREETLAFSAGAEVCIRKKSRRDGREDVRWMTYRPLSAFEGRDDVTTLHLLRPESTGVAGKAQHLITGTANGDLQILRLPEEESTNVFITYLVTQGQPVRSSSILERTGEPMLLAANMGDSRVSLYPVDPSASKIAPLSTVDIRPLRVNGLSVKNQRVWSTQFLSKSHVAAGIGPSDEPIYVFSVTPSGLEKEPFRKFGLQNDHSQLEDKAAPGSVRKSLSSIYPIVPLPPSSTVGGSVDGNIFLSGAYDGVVRLHDLRSSREVEQAYSDPTDDSAIYSLLPRGQETLVAGTSRHSVMKVFDMRLGAKCYSYLDAVSSEVKQDKDAVKDWNLFLKPHSATYSGRGGGNNWARRSQESSIYSLASPSAHSPHLYAGVENAVVELAFTSVLDRHPDPVFFQPWQPQKGGKDDSWRSREVLDLAMYDQTADMKLCTQKSMWETWRSRQSPVAHTLEFPRIDGGLDERWRIGSG